MKERNTFVIICSLYRNAADKKKRKEKKETLVSAVIYFAQPRLS